ncbi:anti-phage dCTP deaminase [Roseomonas sp. F4]
MPEESGAKKTLAGITAADLLSPPSQPALARTISDRLSQELIIAFVGPVGSGVSTSASFINEILEGTYGYRVFPIIKPSDIIKAECHRVGMTIGSRVELNEYIASMQNAGNKLREMFGGDYLAEKIVERICRYRAEGGGYAPDGITPLPGRRAYVVDSLKNTEELDLLKKIYGETLCIFGVFAPDGQREQRLIHAGAVQESTRSLMDRDQSEVATFGQKTRKLFVMADFFLCNDRKKEDLRNRLVRYLELIFDTHIHTPTRAESAMYEASSSAANSACMSRQVGAAIVSKDGELISVGWNDVPKFRGGLYTEDDQSQFDTEKRVIVDGDNRCFKWGGCICHNETRRIKIVDDLAAKLVSKGLLRKGVTAPQVKAALAGSSIDSLIEYSRSIHAEMEAILAIAREGKHSLVGATLYTNTYPCHNCARHIVASGISSVFYIEPYLKSLAIVLHSDAISEDPEVKDKVIFRQFEGVAPRNFLRLFRSGSDRKKNGHLYRTLAKQADPVFRIQLDAPSDYEAKVIVDLTQKEQDASLSTAALGTEGA